MAKEQATSNTLSDVSVGHCRNQWYSVLSANLILLSQGFSFGWIAPVLPLWMSEDTPLTSGPMSTEEISWVVSIRSLGTLSAAFVFHSIVVRLGCKRTMTSCLAILSIISWLLYAFGRTKYEILISRFITGIIGAGVQSTVVLFVTEIADNRIRGTLGSMAKFVRVTGSLIAFIIAAYVDYSRIAFIFMGVPVLFFILFSWLPNTPTYLLRVGKHEEAKKSIRFYKGLDGKSDETVNAINLEYDRLLAVAAQLPEKTDSISLKKLQKPAVYKGLVIGIVLTMLNQYSGTLVLTVYSVRIFQEANSLIDPYMSSIILYVLQIVGTFSSTSLVDTLGRKTLMIVSLAGCTFGLSAMSTYMYLSTLGLDLTIVDWIPVASLGFVIFISSVGVSSLTMLCIVESLPTEARSFGLAVSIVSLNLFSFISSKLFPILSESIHLHGVMLMYAAVCGFGTIFVAVVLKETKGKSLDDIDENEHS